MDHLLWIIHLFTIQDVNSSNWTSDTSVWNIVLNRLPSVPLLDQSIVVQSKTASLATKKPMSACDECVAQTIKAVCCFSQRKCFWSILFSHKDGVELTLWQSGFRGWSTRTRLRPFEFPLMASWRALCDYLLPWGVQTLGCLVGSSMEAKHITWGGWTWAKQLCVFVSVWTQRKHIWKPPI